MTLPQRPWHQSAAPGLCGLANWPGSPRPQLARPRDGRICLQWCTGAPGILSGAWKYLDEELLLAGAELIWPAGARGDEKGHGLCHGTSGNGFAVLKAFTRTADERWLERARRFAVHARSHNERIAAANGRRRYSLFTGDVGTALFAAACLDIDTRYPIIDVIYDVITDEDGRPVAYSGGPARARRGPVFGNVARSRGPGAVAWLKCRVYAARTGAKEAS